VTLALLVVTAVSGMHLTLSVLGVQMLHHIQSQDPPLAKNAQKAAMVARLLMGRLVVSSVEVDFQESLKGLS
jgi:hypothetical protein